MIPSSMLLSSEISVLSVNSRACDSSSTEMLWFLRDICLSRKEVERISNDSNG